MKHPSIQIDRKNKTVTIVMPLEKPRPSRSTGKTLVIATTGGLKTSEELYARQPVCFSANVFFYPKKAAETEGSSAGGRKSRPSMPKNHGRRHDLTDTSESSI
jgi:hypothetical protein